MKFLNLISIKKHKKEIIIVVCLLIIHTFLRFYEMEARTGFGWDQIDNAWAAKNIIVEHKLPLVGMAAKQNAGFFIGPFYYYFVSVFYLLTDLDPVASIYIAGVSSIFTFFVVYLVAKKLFSKEVAYIATFIHTVSYAVITLDRVQWPVNFIVPFSLLFFYFLYKIINGKTKYILYLSLVVGLSFHIHFTSIFYPIILLLTLPLIPRKKSSLKYILLSIPILVLLFLPTIVTTIQSSGASQRSMLDYMSTYYHGFHLRRFFQLTKDAFIQYESILFFPQLKYIGWLLYPLFSLVYLRKKFNKKRATFIYLGFLYFLIPWLVFTTYSGEISNYYFFINRPIVIISVAYLLYTLMKINSFTKFLVLFMLVVYTAFNINKYITVVDKIQSLSTRRAGAVKNINDGEKVEFQEGAAKSYFYYINKERYEK